jgi:hypothetical protein
MHRVSVVLAVALAIPTVAVADVRITVPPSLLGGRVLPANPLPPPDPTQPTDPDDRDAGEVDLNDVDFWTLVWPSAAAAVGAPDDIVFDCDEDLNPTSCGLWGDAAAVPAPGAASLEVAADPPAPATVAVSRKLRPAIGTWMTSQTPRLRWTPAAGATHYNVQIYLGPKRVANAWTTRPELLVPPRVIDQGRYYMWSVWPVYGPRTKPTFGEQVGRSIFGVVLRPRIVFRMRPNGVQAEVRPRIPGGSVVLTGPSKITSRIPRRVTIGANSRFTLNVSRREAEQLTARLVSPGSKPPKGIRVPK